MGKSSFMSNFKQVLGFEVSEVENEKGEDLQEEINEVESGKIEEEIALEEVEKKEVNPLSFENHPRKKTYESDEELEDSQTIFVKPIGFEECKKIANYINKDKMVTINLEDLNNEEAQRLLDFLSGAMEVKKARFITVSKKVYASVPDGTKSYVENEPREIFG